MSRQNVEAFWQKAKTDPGLRQQVEGLTTEGKDAAIANFKGLIPSFPKLGWRMP